MCEFCERRAAQKLGMPRHDPVLPRANLMKIGQQLRAYFEPHMMLDPTPAMAVALEQLRSSAA